MEKMNYKVVGQVVRDREEIAADALKADSFPEPARGRILEKLSTEMKLLNVIIAMETVGHCSRCQTGCDLRRLLATNKYQYIPDPCRYQIKKFYDAISKAN
jgi:hypothetical protein